MRKRITKRNYVVVCYDDERRYVLATRTLFHEVEAHSYASTLANSRQPRVVPVTDYLIQCCGWRTREE